MTPGNLLIAALVAVGGYLYLTRRAAAVLPMRSPSCTGKCGDATGYWADVL